MFIVQRTPCNEMEYVKGPTPNIKSDPWPGATPSQIRQRFVERASLVHVIPRHLLVPNDSSNRRNPFGRAPRVAPAANADQAWKGRLPLPGPRFLTAASFATPQAEGRRLRHTSSHRPPCRRDFRTRPSCIAPTSLIGESGRCHVRNRSERRAR